MNAQRAREISNRVNGTDESIQYAEGVIMKAAQSGATSVKLDQFIWADTKNFGGRLYLKELMEGEGYSLTPQKDEPFVWISWEYPTL